MPRPWPVLILWAIAAGPVLGQGEAERLSGQFREAARKVLPAVVAVRALDAPPGPLPAILGVDGLPLAPADPGGSGVVVDAGRGLVLTNDHVVKNARRVAVTLPDGRERPSLSIRRDPRSDLALVVIEPSGLVAAGWGDSSKLDVGDWVIAVGQPFGLAGSVTAGIVGGKGRGIGLGPYEDFLQTDAAIHPGNSGGPLVNLRGEVVGINTAIKTLGGGDEGIGFAVPAARARWVAGELAERGTVRRSSLGVRIGRLDPEDGVRLKAPGAVPITAVGAGGPASALIRPGDLVVEVGGAKVEGPGSLQALVEVAPPGHPLAVSLLRDGRRVDVGVVPVASADQSPPAALVAPKPVFEQGEVRSPSRFVELGLRLSEPTAELARRHGYAEVPKGLFVRGVEPDGPADRGGLEIGMVVTDAAGKKVETLAGLREALKQKAADRDLIVRVLKGPKAEFRVIIVGEAADAR